MSIFEQATRQKFRFASAKGDLSVEQLWELPLISKGGFDLDSVAREIATNLEAISTKSFVQTKPDPRKAELTAKLEVVKHVIAVKLKEQDEAAGRAERAEKRRKLVEALAAQEDKALASMSREDILKELAAIDGGQ